MGVGVDDDDDLAKLTKDERLADEKWCKCGRLEEVLMARRLALVNDGCSL